ncbi:MAG: DUF6492 family protein [Rhodoferax sp.]
MNNIDCDRVVKEIEVVFSVCAARDIDVWMVAAKHMLQHISAKSFYVLVPDSEVEIFRACTPFQFFIVPESCFVDKYKAKLRDAVEAMGAGVRYGWYLQQVLKLAFLESVKEEGVVLIWDADTVPLRNLNFVGERGEILYYKGSEFHLPYFHSISNMLGMSKTVSFSFIAQCFAVKGSWVRDFFSFVEARHECHWVDALLASVDFREGSGFSEYETLGTFVSNRYDGAWRAIDEPWERCGKGVIGEISNLETKMARYQLRGCAYASFENWDRPYAAHGRLGRFLMRGFHAVRRTLAVGWST